MRSLRADIDSEEVLDLLPVPSSDPIYDPDDYGASQALGALAQAARLDGICFASVRRPHPCVALYQPACLIRCTSAEVLAYLWDGSRISVEQRTPISW